MEAAPVVEVALAVPPTSAPPAPPAPAPPPPPPPEPTPADAQTQEQLRTLRAKIESHEAAEQDMQRQIAELEKNSSEMMEELVELRAKESKPNTKNSNSSSSDAEHRVKESLSLIHI